MEKLKKKLLILEIIKSKVKKYLKIATIILITPILKFPTIVLLLILKEIL
jgi:hypothetical protein